MNIANIMPKIENVLLEYKNKSNPHESMLDTEEKCYDVAQKIGALLLEEAISGIAEPTMENSIMRNEQQYRFHHQATLTLNTRFNQPLQVTRRYYYPWDGEEFIKKTKGFAPKDELWGLIPDSKLSPALNYINCYWAAQATYDESSIWLKDILHIDLSETGVQKTAERFGSLIEANSKDIVDVGESSKECEVLVFSLDATGCPRISDEPIKEPGRAGLKNPTEAKMCTVMRVEKYLEPLPERKSADDNLPKADIRYTGACFGDNDFSEVQTYARQFCLLTGQMKAKKIAALADGQKSNWNIIDEYLHGATQILDFYHACEHLAGFFKLLNSKDNNLPPQYFAWRKMLLDGEVIQVISEMKEKLVSVTKHEENHKATKELQYFVNNLDRMHYDEYLAQGFPIGSGTIEGACKQVIAKRFKRQGMRWRQHDSQAILNLRLHLLNGTLKNQFCNSKPSWRVAA